MSTQGGRWSKKPKSCQRSLWTTPNANSTKLTVKSQITYSLRLLKRTGIISQNSYLNSHRNAYQNPYRNSYWNFEGILIPTRETRRLWNSSGIPSLFFPFWMVHFVKLLEINISIFFFNWIPALQFFKKKIDSLLIIT